MQVGSLVECIKADGFDKNIGIYNKLPVKGKIYTIRGFSEGSPAGVWLEEIVNPEHHYIDGFGEVSFNINRFKELMPPMSISVESVLEEEIYA